MLAIPQRVSISLWTQRPCVTSQKVAIITTSFLIEHENKKNHRHRKLSPFPLGHKGPPALPRPLQVAVLMAAPAYSCSSSTSSNLLNHLSRCLSRPLTRPSPSHSASPAPRARPSWSGSRSGQHRLAWKQRSGELRHKGGLVAPGRCC